MSSVIKSRLISFGIFIVIIIVFGVFVVSGKEKEEKLCEEAGGTVATEQLPGWFFEGGDPDKTYESTSCRNITEAQCWEMQGKIWDTTEPESGFSWDEEESTCYMSGYG